MQSFPLELAGAEVALALGDAERCLSLSRTLAGELVRLNFKFWLPQAWLLEARSSRALGKNDEAVQALEKARAVAIEIGSIWSLERIRASLEDLG